jgi:diguanylate cyclase (GGDEF)-like protein
MRLASEREVMSDRGISRIAAHGVRRFSRIVQLIGLCLIILTVVVAVAVVDDMRRRTEDGYQREITDLGTALSDQTLRYMQAIDPLLREIQERGAELGVRSPDQFKSRLGTEEMHMFLQARLRNMVQLHSLLIISATGRIINSGRVDPIADIDLSDREYFRHFVEHDDRGLFVSAPIISRVDGTSTVLVVRRINAPDGTFLGLISGALDVSYLEQFYQSISASPGRAVTLLRRDGLVLIRYPDTTHNVGDWMAKTSPWYKRVAEGGGTYQSPGFLGPGPAHVSVNPVRAYPLVIDVSVQGYIELAAWRHQAWLLTLAGLAGVAGFALLFSFIAVQFRRQERQAAALRESESEAAEQSFLLGTTLNHMDQGLMMIAADDTVAICNQQAITLLDLPAEFMKTRPKWQDVLTYQWGTNEFERTDAELTEFVRRSALLDGPLVYDRERPNGRFLEVRTTPLPHGRAVRTYTDITDRKRAEQRVDFLAHHDGLTGLPNRVLLHDRLSQGLAQTARSGKSLVVLTLDLDRFKEINDTYGHDAGDRVLVQAADRLRNAVRPTDTVARTGGDEFVVIQCDAPQPEGAVQLAQRFVEVLTLPFDIGERFVTIGTSVGIALWPGDGNTAADLLKNSDIALYRAKADGRGAFRMFEPEMDSEVRDQRAIEQDLRGAIGTDQLDLYFQPQFATDTSVITGFEALLRWQHPTRGDISPAIMIPIAEKSRLISRLGAWVIEAACISAMTWPVPHRVAVNLSAAQFRDGDLPAQVADILRRTGLPACRLELEVTESLLIDGTEQALAALKSLKSMGVRIALDDFGTGYSSLSYLRQFPFDKIKIDQSFIRGLGEDPSALSIVEAILAMGRSLDMKVIAEGIETDQQLQILRGKRCAEVQGFLLGRPMPSAEVGQYLEGSRGKISRIASVHRSRAT